MNDWWMGELMVIVGVNYWIIYGILWTNDWCMSEWMVIVGVNYWLIYVIEADVFVNDGLMNGWVVK